MPVTTNYHEPEGLVNISRAPWLCHCLKRRNHCLCDGASRTPKPFVSNYRWYDLYSCLRDNLENPQFSHLVCVCAWSVGTMPLNVDPKSRMRRTNRRKPIECLVPCYQQSIEPEHASSVSIQFAQHKNGQVVAGLDGLSDTPIKPSHVQAALVTSQ